MDLVSDKGKAILKVNVDQLTGYIEPESRLPHKWPKMATIVIPVWCPATCTVQCPKSQSPSAESLQLPPACTIQCKQTAAGTSQQHSYAS